METIIDAVNFTADGSSATFEVNMSRAGKTRFAMIVWGSSFGGGNWTLEYTPDSGTTWIALPDIFDDATGQTVNGRRVFEAIAPGDYRATLAGSTTPNVNISVHRL